MDYHLVEITPYYPSAEELARREEERRVLCQRLCGTPAKAFQLVLGILVGLGGAASMTAAGICEPNPSGSGGTCSADTAIKLYIWGAVGIGVSLVNTIGMCLFARPVQPGDEQRSQELCRERYDALCGTTARTCRFVLGGLLCVGGIISMIYGSTCTRCSDDAASKFFAWGAVGLTASLVNTICMLRHTHCC